MQNPENYGELIDDYNKLPKSRFPIFLDLDKTRLLAITPAALATILDSKGIGYREATIATPNKDVWVFPGTDEPSENTQKIWRPPEPKIISSIRSRKPFQDGVRIPKSTFSGQVEGIQKVQESPEPTINTSVKFEKKFQEKIKNLKSNKPNSDYEFNTSIKKQNATRNVWFCIATFLFLVVFANYWKDQRVDSPSPRYTSSLPGAPEAKEQPFINPLSKEGSKFTEESKSKKMVEQLEELFKQDLLTSDFAEPASPEVLIKLMSLERGRDLVASKPNEQRQWIIQAGAFAGSKNANLLHDQLLSKKFPTSLASEQIDGRTIYLVKIGPYLSRNEARVVQQRLLKEAEIKGELRLYRR